MIKRKLHPLAEFLKLWLAVLMVTIAPDPLLAQTHAPALAPIHYTITLSKPIEHLLHIEVTLPPGTAQRELQLPVWNATYQVRDFAEYVRWLHARSPSGATRATRKLNKSRWELHGMELGGVVEYEILADQPGPFGAQFNAEHAFFNLAEVLMYPADARNAPMTLRFQGVPAGWRLACPLQVHPWDDDKAELRAANYDTLVDSPVEIGTFQEAAFIENGGHYRIVVDAQLDVYDLPHLTDMLRTIVHAETTWMQDRPFQDYLFLYHFPAQHGAGGMEHANSTAIELSARSLKEDPGQLAAVTGHEFFHLWNVKRIRPQTLAPADYTKENYTRALWFSEGVTSTVEQYALLAGHLIDEKAFLRNLSDEITTLQNRPAHLTQSAEESSMDAWLEKYPFYRQPTRSISYYNKGFLLGIFLDLAIRRASDDQASLRDLFLYLNQTYAKKGRFFDDSEGIRKAAESVSGADLISFFQKYVAGTEEIPYDDFLTWVGLRVVSHEKTIPDPGFRAARNFDAVPTVVYLTPESDASRAGLVVGDAVVALDGTPVFGNFEVRIASRPVGAVLHLRVRGANGSERDLAWKLGADKTLEYEVTEVESPTLPQLLHRRNWLTLTEPKATHANATDSGAATGVLARTRVRMPRSADTRRIRSFPIRSTPPDAPGFQP
jgi:predicted metalloprotease with PDZ domain